MRVAAAAYLPPCTSLRREISVAAVPGLLISPPGRVVLVVIIIVAVAVAEAVVVSSKLEDVLGREEDDAPPAAAAAAVPFFTLRPSLMARCLALIMRRSTSGSAMPSCSGLGARLLATSNLRVITPITPPSSSSASAVSSAAAAAALVPPTPPLTRPFHPSPRVNASECPRGVNLERSRWSSSASLCSMKPASSLSKSRTRCTSLRISSENLGSEETLGPDFFEEEVEGRPALVPGRDPGRDFMDCMEYMDCIDCCVDCIDFDFIAGGNLSDCDCCCDGGSRLLFFAVMAAAAAAAVFGRVPTGEGSATAARFTASSQM